MVASVFNVTINALGSDWSTRTLSKLGITVKKGEDLSEWYTQVVTKAELADYAQMKGFMVLRP